MILKSVSIAPSVDDEIWIRSSTTFDDFRDMAANPFQWVKLRMKKKLADHFSMILQVRDKADTSVTIQGIDMTGFISVRINTQLKRPMPTAELKAEPNLRIKFRSDVNLAYLHLEIGEDTYTVADFLLATLTDPASYLAFLKGLVDAGKVTMVLEDGVTKEANGKLKQFEVPSTCKPTFELPKDLNDVVFCYEGRSLELNAMARAQAKGTSMVDQMAFDPGDVVCNWAGGPYAPGTGSSTTDPGTNPVLTLDAIAAKAY